MAGTRLKWRRFDWLCVGFRKVGKCLKTHWAAEVLYQFYRLQRLDDM